MKKILTISIFLLTLGFGLNYSAEIVQADYSSYNECYTDRLGVNSGSLSQRIQNANYYCSSLTYGTGSTGSSGSTGGGGSTTDGRYVENSSYNMGSLRPGISMNGSNGQAVVNSSGYWTKIPDVTLYKFNMGGTELEFKTFNKNDFWGGIPSQGSGLYGGNAFNLNEDIRKKGHSAAVTTGSHGNYGLWNVCGKKEIKIYQDGWVSQVETGVNGWAKFNGYHTASSVQTEVLTWMSPDGGYCDGGTSDSGTTREPFDSEAYFSDFMDAVDNDSFAEDYMDQINDNMDRYGEEYGQDDPDIDYTAELNFIRRVNQICLGETLTSKEAEDELEVYLELDADPEEYRDHVCQSDEAEEYYDDNVEQSEIDEDEIEDRIREMIMDRFENNRTDSEQRSGEYTLQDLLMVIQIIQTLQESGLLEGTNPTNLNRNQSNTSSNTNTGTNTNTNTNTNTQTNSAFNSSSKLTRDLQVGSTGNDVKTLQQFLNQNGYIITTSGPGSKGQESTYFGELTRQALARYQAANGITPANGYFGDSTRTKVLGQSGGNVVIPADLNIVDIY